MVPKLQQDGPQYKLKLVGSGPQFDGPGAGCPPWIAWLMTYSLFAAALAAGVVVMCHGPYVAWLGSFVVFHVLCLWLRCLGVPVPEPRRFSEPIVRVVEAFLRTRGPKRQGRR